MSLFERKVSSKNLYICELGIVKDVVLDRIGYTSYSMPTNEYVICKKKVGAADDIYTDIFTGTKYIKGNYYIGCPSIIKATQIITNYKRIPISILVHALQTLNPIFFTANEVDNNTKLDIKSLKLGTLKYEK